MNLNKKKAAKMNNDLLFSIIVPVYNTEQYLTRCLDSIANQTIVDYEVIVVDDGSSVDCSGVVAKFGHQFHYFRHERNMSLLQSRLTGLRVAKGRYVIPVDSDDYLSSDLLKVLKDCVDEQFPDVIQYNMIVVENGHKVSPWHNQKKRIMSSSEALNAMFDGHLFWTMCGKAVKTEIYRKAVEAIRINNNVYINHTEDLCQTVAILLYSESFYCLGYSGYYYVKNSASLSQSKMNEEKVKRIITENSRCINLLTDFLANSGDNTDIIEKIRSLAAPTIRWLLSEVYDVSDSIWSRYVNEMCKAYGVPVVLKACYNHFGNFLLRFKPDRDIFVSQDTSQVKVIGVVCGRANGGGAEIATQLWMRKMAETGKQIVWISDRDFFDVNSQVKLPKDVVMVAIDHADITLRYKEISAAVNKFSIDTLYVVDHWSTTMFYDIIIAKANNLRVIVADHSAYLFPFDEDRPDLFILRSNLYPIANAVTTLSPMNVAWWQASGLTNVVYMPNFLTFESSAMTLNIPSKPHTPFNLVYVGAICQRKNLFAVLEAFSLVLDKIGRVNNSVRLIVLGRYRTKKDEKKVRAVIDKLDIANYVSIKGEVTNVSEYLSQASLLVMASRIEGAPMSLMEAKSFGVPAVIFELPYVDSTSQDDGVVSVPYGDVSAMADAIYHCFSDSQYYERLSTAAIKSLANFSSEVIISKWEKIFTMVCSGVPDSQCNEVDSKKLLLITMAAISRLAWPLYQFNLEKSPKLTFERIEAKIQHLLSRFVLSLKNDGITLTFKKIIHKAIRLSSSFCR